MSFDLNVKRDAHPKKVPHTQGPVFDEMRPFAPTGVNRGGIKHLG
jgi:hypothetical protein